jgi:hypothetical protein
MRTLLVGILGLSSVVCMAQTQEPPAQQVQRTEVPPTPRHPQPAHDGGVREVLESIVIPPIPHAPFFATLATESREIRSRRRDHDLRQPASPCAQRRWAHLRGALVSGAQGLEREVDHELDSDRRSQAAHALQLQPAKTYLRSAGLQSGIGSFGCEEGPLIR